MKLLIHLNEKSEEGKALLDLLNKATKKGSKVNLALPALIVKVLSTDFVEEPVGGEEGGNKRRQDITIELVEAKE